jgi:hypothetical protein
LKAISFTSVVDPTTAASELFDTRPELAGVLLVQDVRQADQDFLELAHVMLHPEKAERDSPLKRPLSTVALNADRILGRGREV